jgi:D-alanine-D-alanine ligase
VATVEELPAAMVRAFNYGPVAVVERFVEGVEVAVPIIDTGAGPRAYPPVEIRPDSGIYDYEARYTLGATAFTCPSTLPEPVLARVVEAAVTAYRALGLRDLGRIDLIVEPDGRPVFLEGNVAPGMTEMSTVPLAIEAAGDDLGAVLAQLVDQAAARR